MNPGIHLIHKPPGPSSFSLLREYVEKAKAGPGERQPKICHGGTLDPFAQGLLLILVEPATRLFDYLHAVPKTYQAVIQWGTETDNGDHLGHVTFTGDPSGLDETKLNEALATFIGWQDQIPPAASAKRIDGERAYLKFHRGESVVMPPSRVYLHEARWLSHDLPRQSRLELVVRGGYFIRALARDLGRLIGCGAHVAALHRTEIGPWADPGPGQPSLMSGRAIMPWAPTRLLSDKEVGELRQRRTIPAGTLIEPDWALPAGFPDSQAPVRGFHRERFCFLLQPEEGALRLLCGLRGGL